MKLLTKKLRKQLPELYSQEDRGGKTRPRELKNVAEQVGESFLKGAENTKSTQKKAAGAEGIVINDGEEGDYREEKVVEDAGLEPAASTMPLSRSPS